MAKSKIKTPHFFRNIKRCYQRTSMLIVSMMMPDHSTLIHASAHLFPIKHNM